MFEDVVSGHKFNVGQTVNYIPQFGAGASKSAYTITQKCCAGNQRDEHKGCVQSHQGASPGAAIIGEATACSISRRNRSGERTSMPIATQLTPKMEGTASAVHSVAATMMPRRRRWSRGSIHLCA